MYPRTLLAAAALSATLCGPLAAPAAADAVSEEALQERIAALETLVATLETRLQNQGSKIRNLREDLNDETDARLAAATVTAQAIDGLGTRVADLGYLTGHMTRQGDDLFFQAVNVHIQNGAADSLAANALGNLIIGYDEAPAAAPSRSGSHNLVIGPRHEYTSTGGLAVGDGNTLGAAGSVAFGKLNVASGPNSSVTGGYRNTAFSSFATVTGGSNNRAASTCASVTGGDRNTVLSMAGVVVGGQNNEVRGDYSTVTGGYESMVRGSWSTIIAGYKVLLEKSYVWAGAQ